MSGRQMNRRITRNQRSNVLFALAGFAFGGAVSITDLAHAVTWRRVAGANCATLSDPGDMRAVTGAIYNEDDLENESVFCPLTDDSDGFKRNLTVLNLHVADGSNDEGIGASLCMQDPWGGSYSCGIGVYTNSANTGYSTMDMVGTGVRPTNWTNAAWDPWIGVLAVDLPDDDVYMSGILMYYQAY